MCESKYSKKLCEYEELLRFTPSSSTPTSNVGARKVAKYKGERSPRTQLHVLMVTEDRFASSPTVSNPVLRTLCIHRNMSRKSKCLVVTFSIIAVILLILAVVSFIMLSIFDRLFLSMLAKNLVLQPGSPMFDQWLSPSVPILFKVYLMNLTNEDEVLAGGRPRLRQVGPFVYREHREHYDVQFSNDSSPRKIRYKHRIFYSFQPDLSSSDPTTVAITTPHLFCLSPDSYWVRYGISCGPFTTLTAEKAMWGYYPTPIVSMVGTKVGLFVNHNGTDVHEFLADVGAENIQDIGKIYEADGKKKLTVWDNDEANMIKGTDGSLAPPGLQVGSTVTLYVPEICRSPTLYATGKKNTVNLKDVEIIVFTGAPADPTEHLFEWRNRIFCQANSGCPPKGLVALEPCLNSKGINMPMYLSQPFFMDADPRISEQFDGLPTPNSDQHETTVHIEPTTGFVLEAFKRIQFNVLMRNTDPMFKKMKNGLYFPIGWVEETAIPDKQTLEEVYYRILLPRKQIPIILSIVSGVTTFLTVTIILSLAIHLRCSKRNAVVCPSVPSTKSTTPLEEELNLKITTVITAVSNWDVRQSENYLRL
ncbi:hypothetical protein P879_01049 [Paragonimus westermani]|uniref:Lysosome membrane protein 2 n=1 Tax=Paragonimus westermani TaxID=34504 RepID=A0A8T0DSF2_9TREM|nr:hypothetical protein P879_01049 [Paragonimus westermani]